MKSVQRMPIRQCGLHESTRGSQRGVGLIEVLFAVLVLAIGLLGMAGLQLTSIRNSQSAMTRGMAVVQAYSIIAAMQADKQQRVMPDAYNIALGATLALGSTPAGGASFRDQALSNWLAGITNAMGNGAQGGVSCTQIGTSADYRCTISVRWDDSRAQDRGTATPAAAPTPFAQLDLQVVI